jgi:UDP-N-acetylmuramoyl-L-alanyl-D-glutamate--2,6-diaminopimelate ligase
MSELRPLAELVRLLGERGLLLGEQGARAAEGSEAAASAHGHRAGAVAAGIGVRRVSMDSQRVRPGDLFVALGGRRHDGHAFAVEAAASGAVAVLAERPVPGLAVPQLIVGPGRPALALAAAWANGFPSRHLGIVGITGTDGKTTTAWLVRSVLEHAGLPTGLVGTIDVICAGRSLGNAARATTPEAPELQGYLAAMRAAGDRWAVVESTSHGLAQDRVGEIAYDVAVLTNITQEHLEFHGTLEAYRAAKRSLFERLAVGPANPEKGYGKSAVINADDGAADDFSASARRVGARLITYGLGATRDRDVRAEAVTAVGTGLLLDLVTPRWRGALRLRLAGRFNAHNALAAIAVGEALELDPDAIVAGLEAVSAVPGRMEVVDAGQPFGVVVDYAHTAEALDAVLADLASPAAASGGGLIAVFGSAGDRDVVKRPLMGEVAGRRCRIVVLADEDPRGEDPLAILEAIAAGAEAAGKRRGDDLFLIPDRAAAIAHAFALAGPGDIVVLAGKGHEKTIEMRHGVQAWDEASEARAALARLGHGSAVVAAGDDGLGEGDASGAGQGPMIV